MPENIRENSEHFGNTFTEVRRSLIFGLTLFAFVAVAVSGFAYARGALHSYWPTAILGALAVGGIAPLIVWWTSLFSIRVDGQHITHFFLRRFILSERPLSELGGIDFNAGLAAVAFRFSDGSSMRFTGAHLGAIVALCHRIFEFRPDLRSKLKRNAPRQLRS